MTHPVLDSRISGLPSVDSERLIDAFLRPPMTRHDSRIFSCGDYWRRACSCGYVSGPHISEDYANAEPCPRQAADMLHRLRLGQDKDEILAGLSALQRQGTAARP